MTEHLIPWLAVLAVPGWIIAALLLGLFLGERFRRLDAQRVADGRAITDATARRLPDQADAEMRAIGAGRAQAERQFTDETIDRGIAQLQAEARATGRRLSDRDAREQVISMLYGEAQTAESLPGLGL